jgi:hypothetical protein
MEIESIDDEPIESEEQCENNEVYSDEAEAEAEAEVEPEPEPEDASISTTRSEEYNSHLVKYVFCLLGIGFLLPWNAFVSAAAYFETRLCTETDSSQATDDQQPLQSSSNFMLWFGLLYNFSGVTTLGLMLTSQRINERKVQRHGYSHIDALDITGASATEIGRNHQWRMIVISLAFFLLVMILTTSMVLMPSIDPALFRSITLLSAATCGTAGAFASAGIISFANIFPPKIGIQPFISGNAVGGVVISILNLSLSAMESNGADAFWEEHCNVDANHLDGRMLHGENLAELESSSSCLQYRIDWGAFSYFFAGCAFLASCIGLFVYLDRHPVTEYYRTIGRQATPTVELTISSGETPQNEMTELQSSDMNQNDLTEPLLEASSEGTCLNPSLYSRHESVESESNIALVWKHIRAPSTCVFMTFFVTLTIFPSWTTKLESVKECQEESSRLRNDLFDPAFIVLFNVCDLMGRTASGSVNLAALSPTSFAKRMYAASYARLIFLPLFLFCKASGSRLVPQFGSDWFPLIFLAVFSFTNGFLSTLSFIQAAISTPAGEELQQIASTVLNFSVGLGLLSGSLFSFLYNYVGTL